MVQFYFVQTWVYNNTKENGLLNVSTFGLSKTGYTFVGWGTKSDGGTVFSQSDTSLKASDINPDVANKSCSITLYAQWSHTHNYNIFLNYQTAPPHYAVYKCDCGKTMTSNAGFLQKIIVFFKMIFGMNQIIPESLKSVALSSNTTDFN